MLQKCSEHVGMVLCGHFLRLPFLNTQRLLRIADALFQRGDYGLPHVKPYLPCRYIYFRTFQLILSLPPLPVRLGKGPQPARIKRPERFIWNADGKREGEKIVVDYFGEASFSVSVLVSVLASFFCWRSSSVLKKLLSLMASRNAS